MHDMNIIMSLVFGGKVLNRDCLRSLHRVVVSRIVRIWINSYHLSKMLNFLQRIKVVILLLPHLLFKHQNLLLKLSNLDLVSLIYLILCY